MASQEEALQREKLLLYVAATREKKWLLITSSGQTSPFQENSTLRDLEMT